MVHPVPITTRLELAADRPTGVRFVGHSVAPADGPSFVTWRQLHDEARVVAIVQNCLIRRRHF